MGGSVLGVGLLLVCLSACGRGASPSDGAGDAPGDDAPIGDVTPPVFAGITSVLADTAYSLQVGWAPATDDFTRTAFIEYRIFVAAAPGRQDFGSPASTVKGTPGGIVGALLPEQTYYVVVRAADSSGNLDANTVEMAVTTPAAPPARSFANDIAPVFATTCSDPQNAPCHQPPMLAQGLDLSTAAAGYAALVGQPSSENSRLLRVKAGNSGQSYLVRKLLGLVNPLTEGERMPLASAGLPPLSDALIALVREWIDQGAADN